MPHRRLKPLPRPALREFLATESAGGVVLLAGAIAALMWANSPWSATYADVWGWHDLRHWINDGLMTVFFLVVGLEVKRELTRGHLASWRAAATPALAAVGGMAVPALVYLAIAGSTAPRGWAVPMATDIALAVAVALERGVHPWASFVVVPVFALANAGITVTGAGLRDAFGSALTWGIVAGLVLGKPIGVLAGRAILTRDTPPRLAGIGAAAGIGFTVALFIAELAFDDPIQHDQAKLAILVASLLAGCLSTALLRRP